MTVETDKVSGGTAALRETMRLVFEMGRMIERTAATVPPTNRATVRDEGEKQFVAFLNRVCPAG